MARDDWRVRVELAEEHAHGLLERLGLDLGSEARELARELQDARLAVSRDGDTLFVYTASGLEAEQARRIVEAELQEQHLEARSIRIERWLDDEERWNDEPPTPSIEQETLARGYAPWEVRVECASHREAERLADELEREGYSVLRRWRYVIAGTQNRADAAELARRVHGEVEPGGELVWEVVPQNPFAVFGGLGGSGTPL